MKRAEILEAARVCVCGERERDYGTPENNFETIGLLWGVYLRAAHPELARVMAVNHITAKDVAAMKMDQVASSQNDEFYTPEYAIKPILKYLKMPCTVWCPFDTAESNFVKMLKRYAVCGVSVVHTHIAAGDDFFSITPPPM